ncbi:hypothetical protein ERC79_16605 [Rhodococcus sp. ABRD24]|uniref:hypothetical protein n=1 Tax=Rhodococcus sp. ABRD24 TaxID=2507582 RepID=UPI00103D04A4|nr:hypothetical protein [Rhodococcus sp. ABRD24]QBJ97376.1 hypothetical protein ERC79_16605 [Rhodococcus sp. ABRD24]
MMVVVGVALAALAYVVAAAAMNWIRRPNREPWIRGTGWVLLLVALGALVWFVAVPPRDSAFLIGFLIVAFLLSLLHQGLLKLRNRRVPT